MADFLFDEGKNKVEGLKKTEINQALESKADAQAVASAFESVNTALNGKASTQALNQAVQDINTELNSKANKQELIETQDVLKDSKIINWIPAKISEFNKDTAYKIDGSTFSSASYFSVKFVPQQNYKYRITTVINSIDDKIMAACIFLNSNNEVIGTFGVAPIGETLRFENADLIFPENTTLVICTSMVAHIPYAFIELSDYNNITETTNDLCIINNSINVYPNNKINILISDFVKGLRHNQQNAKLKYDNAYLVTNTPYNFNKGDLIIWELDSTYTIFLVDVLGNFVATNIQSNYIIPNDLTAYIEIRKSGIMPNDISNLTIQTKSLINKMVDDIKKSIEQTNEMEKKTQSIDYVIGYDNSSIKNGYHVINGNETATSAALSCCDFIECKTGDVFLILYCQSISKYNEFKEFSLNIGVASLPLYSGNEKWNMWVADFDGYIRVTFYNDKTTKFAITKLSDKPFEIVCLGDSIIGNRQKPYDCPTYIQNITNVKTANCGFGGTRAATHSQSIYTPLSFWSIADAIASGDWSNININWNQYGDHVFMVNKDILINIDWAKVKLLFVHYGTNDWNGNTLIDNQNDKYDKTTFKGALRYGIETILNAYKNITIVLSSPLFRYWSDSPNYSTVDRDSDTETRTGGTLPEFVDAMREVAEEYHLPFIDNYNELGMNKFNAPAFLSDGTHPSFFNGIIKIGSEMGGNVAKTFSNARFGE